MHTIKLKVQDSVLDKIMYFLQKLPKNEVEIIENKRIFQKEEDFISHFSANPIMVNGDFLTRDAANER